MQLILLGAPGSGKGTMADALTKEYGISHISTGDIFRSNIKGKTPLGMEAKTYIDKGVLVPDEITIRMLRERLSNSDCQNGFMLDGFPRNIQQAEELENILSEMNVTIDGVIRISVPDSIIKERVSSRRVCVACGASYNTKYKPTKLENVCDSCGSEVIQREDDKEETVQVRLETYRNQTAPLIDFYEKKGLIMEANNENDFQVAWKQVQKAFEAKGLAH